MKLKIEINNLSKCRIKNSFFKDILENTLKQEEFDYLRNKKISVSLALVNSREIRRLNRIYRKKDSNTDVLSFWEYKDAKEIKKTLDKNIFLGEIILCYNYIKKYAEKNKTNKNQELAKTFSHGILHLLGLKHGKKMFKIQREIIKKIKFTL